MARKKTTKTEEVAEAALSKTGSARERSDARKPAASRKGRGRNAKAGNGRSRAQKGFDKSVNKLLEMSERETPRSGDTSQVFPVDSASVMAFGNMITSPGQDNFIENYNQVAVNLPFATAVEFGASELSKRTANAMRIDLVHYFGAMHSGSTALMSPLEMASLNLKQFVDTSFGTRTDYDPQDLGIYLMAISAVFPIIAEIKRDLRLALAYVENQYPQFVPKGLFALLGIADGNGNYVNGEGALYTAQNLRKFIDELNQLIITFNRLPMPPDIPAFGYNDYLFDHIFADSDDLQTAQIYLFKNKVYWLYDEEAKGDVGAQLIPIELGNTSIEARLTRLGFMISKLTALRTSSTSMLQNLFNAFGSRDTITVPTLDINEITPVDIVHDPNIGTMIENMTLKHWDYVKPSIISAKVNGRINGGIYARANDADGLAALWMYSANLPLQFHKPFDAISHEDIGWAMRLHMPMLEAKKQTVVPYGTSGSSETEYLPALWADGYEGFAYCAGVTMASLQSNGAITFSSAATPAASQAIIAESLDFHYRPIWVSGLGVADGARVMYALTNYYAARDVEFTYRLEDMKMFWTYLTINQWAANVNRNVLGSRER